MKHGIVWGFLSLVGVFLISFGLLFPFPSAKLRFLYWQVPLFVFFSFSLFLAAKEIEARAFLLIVTLALASFSLLLLAWLEPPSWAYFLWLTIVGFTYEKSGLLNLKKGVFASGILGVLLLGGLLNFHLSPLKTFLLFLFLASLGLKGEKISLEEKR